jgi:hypothetical protein
VVRDALNRSDVNVRSWCAEIWVDRYGAAKAAELVRRLEEQRLEQRALESGRSPEQQRLFDELGLEVTGGVTNFVARLPQPANSVEDWKASLIEHRVSDVLAPSTIH